MSLIQNSIATHFYHMTMLVGATVAIVGLSACQQPPDYSYLSGETMGTSYHISYQLPKEADETAIQAAIEARLQDINDSMSTYQDDSTISKFNRLSIDTPIMIDADFSQVLAISRQVYEQSNGAFDPTVMPLIELWGFGSTMTVERLQRPPSALEIAQAKALVNFGSVIQQDNSLYKTVEGVGLDFSAVAKGYGVDVIADVLRDNYQIRNYMSRLAEKLPPLGSIISSSRGKLPLMHRLRTARSPSVKPSPPFGSPFIPPIKCIWQPLATIVIPLLLMRSVTVILSTPQLASLLWAVRLQ